MSAPRAEGPSGPAALPHPRRAFAERLAARPLLVDGAMGTLLFSRGIPQRASLDELVEAHPDMVGAIHREYAVAGADILETCTFGANRMRLAPYGLADRAGRLNRRAAQLAREARDVAGRDVLVAGSMGPLAAPIHGPEHPDERAMRAAIREQVEGLLEGGVDLLLIETASDLEGLLLAVAEARALCDLPVIAAMTFGEDLAAMDGTTPEVAAHALAAAGVDALGVNCGVGPVACVDALDRMTAEAAGIAALIMPNAGLPARVQGQFVYAAGPAYFADAVPGFLSAGARLIGGCCGTTPDHIAAMRQMLDKEIARARGTAGVADPASGAAGRVARSGSAAGIGERSLLEPGASPRSALGERAVAGPPQDAPPPTGLARRLAEGHFVISVEIDPPRSVRIERTIEAARLLQEAGVDLVNISDSAMARVRMGAMAVAFGIQHDLDLECLVHLTTRDRNLMALESELLGAHALGVRDILALTGDPPRVGDYPTGTGIWDIDSTGLIGVIQRLNRGEDQAGKPIGAPAGFTVACALDPTAGDLEHELDRLTGKLDAGADLIMTQPIYARDQWDRFMERASRRWGDRLPRPVLLGVLPLHTSRHAEFLHHEVPGITIPDRVRSAMATAGDRGAEVGLELAAELLAEMRPLVSGTYIMPSFGRYEQSAELVRRLRATEPTLPGRSRVAH
ncbi:MAG: bifunctional homocysteine S-methyltransferase/methylenetetrahydrofolate reductase [Chloroflexi bacterium]|nr:bifunctional homocysteine S-methyltransferase/methylenetetrahydrofolate reductase [Chloroflexota bacterium]